MPIAPSRELVLKKIRDCFPDPAVASQALAALDTYGIELWQREKERVQLAILKICDPEKLVRYTEDAWRDYRDILIPAEFYEESQSSSKTPPQEMAAIRERDRRDYDRWLKLSLASLELVIKKVHDCFPNKSDADQALVILETYGTEHWHREKYRVHLALLRISSGNLDTLRQCTLSAQSEFRRTIESAECVEESESASSNISAQKLAAIRQNDFENYERWLTT